MPGGAGLSAQVMLAVDQLSRELRRDHREDALREADQALAEGLSEAHELREQAGCALTGAAINGALTAASGAAQGLAAADIETSAPEGQGPLEAFRAHNTRAEVASRAAATGGQLGGVAQGAADAYGKGHEASSREHGARAQAASRRADAEQGAAQDAQKSSDKIRDLYLQVLSLDHASRMAVLKG